MEQLWSPWRSHYIQSFSSETPAKDECFLCTAAMSDMSKDEDLLIVGRREHCFIIMNRYPYNAGHLMVTPYRHVGDFSEVQPEELYCIMQTLQEATEVFKKVLKPHGFNIGANLGQVAGAGLPGHIHFHIVPRWNGDTNFMPVLSDVKVVSESMEDMQKKLSLAFKK
ncbi:MAG TPA: HIT domain-containing protein [Patescibacteria group bacterium]|nr:HIT domain-containing protein [Patescibacteria group bacterium]